MSLPYTDSIKLIDAVTSTTTSTAYDISKRQQVTLQFIASGITSGNAVFTVDVSNDGTNWITGVAFLDPVTTAVSVFSASQTLSANGTKGAIVITGWRLLRVKATVTTDGTYTALMQNAG